MRRKGSLWLLLLVLLPVGLAAVAGLEVLSSERGVVERQLTEAFEGRLLSIKDQLRQLLADAERDLDDRVRALEGARGVDPEALAALVRAEPLALAVFALAPDGRLFYPLEATASVEEKQFLVRTEAIWKGRAILYEPKPSEGEKLLGRGPAEPSSRRRDTVTSLSSRRDRGWIAWHWEEGLHLLWWRRVEGLGVLGFEVDRVALLARLVGSLADPEVGGGRLSLVDSRGDAVVVFGGDDGAGLAEGQRLQAETIEVFASAPLEHPLDTYRLVFEAPAAELAAIGASTRLALGLALAGFTLVLGLMGFLLHQEHGRELAEAAARMGFVTNVSHELKTPLTNIRLYAELLDDQLDEDDPGPRAHLRVIVSESQRLSRLISNVLSFSRAERGKLGVEPRPTELGAALGAILRQFEPALAEKGISIVPSLGPALTIDVDPDALGQIVGNLLGNVEKYAGPGPVEVTVRDAGAVVHVDVSDHGPGVPPAARARIFEPFFRASDRLTDGVAGTGIGLTIARELARRHGGELVLLDTPDSTGATFRLILPKEARRDAGPGRRR